VAENAVGNGRNVRCSGRGPPLGSAQRSGRLSSGGLLHTATPSGAGYLGQTIRANTSPSIASLPGGGFEVAFVSNSAGGRSGVLTVYGTAFTFNTQLGVMANTSPAIATAPDGSF
jgi:hypothetical protein